MHCYSFHKAVDGGFCRFCALFARHRNKLGVLVNKAFVTWVKVHKATYNVAMYMKYCVLCLISALDSVFLQIRTRQKESYEVW